MSRSTPHCLYIQMAIAAVALSAVACAGGDKIPDGPPDLLQCGRLSALGPDNKLCVPTEVTGAKDNAVSFDSGDTPGGRIQLNGTLSMPAFANADTRAPAVLLLADDGPLNRDGATDTDMITNLPAPVPVLRDIAQALSARGFAVLRYDKRSCATCDYPEQVHSNATWEDLTGDAVAAAQFLKAQPGVASDDLIVIGHGQGATLALAAQTQLSPQALVLVGASLDPIDQTLTNAMRAYIAAGEGALDKAALDDANKRLSEIESSMLAVKDGSFPEDFLVLDAHFPAFWMAWIDASGQNEARLQSFNGDVLFIRGGDDTRATGEQQTRFEAILNTRPGSDAVSLPGHGHALQATGGEPSVTAQAHKALLEWLSKP